MGKPLLNDPRIVVIGPAAAGKSSLASALSQRLNISHIELDALQLDAHWVSIPTEVFQQRTMQAIEGHSSWVVDGGQSAVRELVWPRANLVIWLDYPLWLLLYRVLRRSLWRIIMQAEVSGGRRERWRQFISRDSLLWWAVRVHRNGRKHYPGLFRQAKYAHLTVMQLKSPRQLQRWLSDWMMSTSRQD